MKAVLIGCAVLIGIVFVGFIALTAVGLYYANKIKVPDLPAAGTFAGADAFVKSPLVQDARIETATDLVVRSTEGKPAELVVVSASGALYLDTGLTAQKWVSFEDSSGHIDLIDTTNDGTREFLRRGGWSQDAAVLNSDGNVVWTYGGSSGVDDMAAGNLDGNGTLSYVVGFNGGGGVHRVDGAGKKVWSKSGGNIWHVEIFDTDGDGTAEILHSSAAGAITVRDAQGNLLREFQVGEYDSFFSPCRWPGAADRLSLIVANDGSVVVGDTNGKTLQRYTAPDCIQLADARAVPVTFVTGEPAHFAVLISMHDTSMLYIYDSTAALVYHESLGEGAEALATWPTETGESLLIGATGQVWQYRPASAPVAPEA